MKTGLLKRTILDGQFRRRADEYLKAHRLSNDYSTALFNNAYDLAVLCTDLIVPGNLRKIKTIWVQEGMTDPLTPWAKLMRKWKLPPLFIYEHSIERIFQYL